jgi:hypothetical protein
MIELATSEYSSAQGFSQLPRRITATGARCGCRSTSKRDNDALGLRTMRKIAAVATAMMGGLAASLFLTPSAHADPEQDFCGAMAAVGQAADCGTLSSLARDVCDQFDRGIELDAILEQLDGATKNQGLSNFIVAGAPMYFCPEHGGKV